jgi:hypothetical protein
MMYVTELLDTSNNERGLCMRRMMYSTNFFLVVAILVWLSGIISGITLGDSYPILQVTGGTALFPEYEEHFNYPLMFGVWFGAFALGVVFVFFAAARDYFNRSAYKLTQVYQLLEQASETEPDHK